ncbi:unnamed protein product [Meloidogyne enterolobii]|uniref:Uncharacterized protein n=1 Tax=Meloidogyne enterolobii TaxID=390850 RepID=A0ACB0YUG3_MELEN
MGGGGDLNQTVTKFCYQINKGFKRIKNNKYISTDYHDYFFDIALQLVNQILTKTFPEGKIDMAYEKFDTIGYYLGIIFTKNDESADITGDYVDKDVEDYEYHVPQYYTDDEDV